MSVKSPLADDTAFYVTSWVTGNVIQVCADLTTAKKLAKAQGHAPWNKWNGYAPMAFVAADVCQWDWDTASWSKTKTDRVLVYNPRFSGNEK